jgi:polyisoprenoid-binding protein YceI
MATRRRRRLLWVLIGAAALVAIAAVAGPYVYIHFIEGPAPAKLELPPAKGATTTSMASNGSASTSSSLDGTWNVGTGSLAGYRVQEVLLGQSATAVGRTDQIWGSLTIAGSTVTKGSFTVDMASVVSDQSQRNAHFDGPIMDVSQYPTAMLTLTSPINLGAIPANGVVQSYDATGALDMHGTTRTVSFTVSAERSGSQIDVLADITIPFSEWNISNPSIGGFVTTANNGTLEVLLHLTQGAGNGASTSPGSSGSVGGGAPITVPSTTVPPLTVPSG